ncbi:hypothetical protein HID58_094413 [Brassica napus]|uniref:Uncharacterized protein n=1 Tax=Brassica napus TaxID=3708 RepID=A0ABQ7X7F1_BRANA|nr:hypothetical protein HID58_094413 [Brassica napus]
MCGVSAAILLGSLITLGCIDEDDERQNFRHQGGTIIELWVFFFCPFVPYLRLLCILIKHLLDHQHWVKLDMDQGLEWMLIGSMIYLFYGRSHSVLNNAGYVPTTCTWETTDLLV